MVLLVVESDAACTSVSGYSARKSALLFWYEATKPEVIQNKICEGTDCLNAALNSGMASLQVMVASARSLGWGSSENLTLLLCCTLSKCTDVQYANTCFINISDQRHSPSPLI